MAFSISVTCCAIESTSTWAQWEREEEKNVVRSGRGTSACYLGSGAKGLLEVVPTEKAQLCLFPKGNGACVDISRILRLDLMKMAFQEMRYHTLLRCIIRKPSAEM